MKNLIDESLVQMRETVITGIHPHTLHSGPIYTHVPLPATFGAMAQASVETDDIDYMFRVIGCRRQHHIANLPSHLIKDLSYQEKTTKERPEGTKLAVSRRRIETWIEPALSQNRKRKISPIVAEQLTSLTPP